MKFQIFLMNHKWHWLCVSKRGVECKSAGGFPTQAGCIRCIEALKTTINQSVPVEILDKEHRE